MSGKKAMRPTIYDVAREADVSIATVSRYMNKVDAVSADTGSRIAFAMEKLDYIPQGNAGSKPNRSVGRIGVLTPFFPAPSFVRRLQGLLPVFTRANHEVVIYTIDGPEQLNEYLSSVPFTRRMDGLILMSVRLTEEQRRRLSASGLPVVMIETDDNHYSRVLADDYRGGELAARLFIDRNYFPCIFLGDKNRNIAYSLHPSDVRLRGFADTLIKAGKVWNENMVEESDTSVEDAFLVFQKILADGKRPRAVFAMSDLQAIGVYKAARQQGLRMPQDLSVLGFDDIEASDWMGLSTISQYLTDSGRIAAELLLDLIVNGKRAIQKINLEVRLIERDTT